jgi:hypothetical protein
MSNFAHDISKENLPAALAAAVVSVDISHLSPYYKTTF